MIWVDTHASYSLLLRDIARCIARCLWVIMTRGKEKKRSAMQEERSVSQELSSSARSFQEMLRVRGFSHQVVELPGSTRTAKEAAQAVGCQVEQIVKSLVFKGQQSQRAILVLASGPNRVSESRLGELAGEPIEKADADFVRQQTGFVIGGVPPLGHRERLKTFIDETLLRYELLWAAAGTPHAVFQLTPADLQAMTDGLVAAVTEHPSR
jgi:prolyl-tRNA editing enzyme YbaK/EbsC (Cys-tRNA(Pro) deacylase)